MRTGPARGRTGNFHEAGFYGSDAEFLALIVPFVTDGAAVGEPVVLGYDTRKCDLLRAVLPQPDTVAFLGDSSLYATPACAIEAYRHEFERHLAAGAEQIRIAGDVPHEGNGGRFAGWDRYESAVNAVWEDYPVWSRCLYDATTVSDDVRDVVERTHRRLVAPDGSAAPSPRYQEVQDFRALPPPVDPLEATSPDVSLVDASLNRTRQRVADAVRGRLDPRSYDDLLFALSEAVLNAELHGRPPVTVRAWTAPDRAVVRVHDTGPGPDDSLTGLVPVPEGAAGAGLGLWLCHQRAGVEVALVTDDDGFAVRMRAGRLTGPATTPGRVPLCVGTAGGAPSGRDQVHVIDGDDSSLCELVDATRLVPLDDVLWSAVPADQQCPACRFLVTGDLGLQWP
jgi:anti-sigma regulatory factor (Ser/Thr protein kinase)